MSTWGRCDDCGEETFRSLHRADVSRRRRRLNKAFDDLPKRLRQRAKRAGELAHPVGTLSIRDGDVITKAVGALGPEFKRLERRVKAAERERDEALIRLHFAWREGYFTGKRDFSGSITGGQPISTPNPYEVEVVP